MADAAVSMSRVSDATSATGLTEDGTAAASWQSSIRRDAVRNTGNANLIRTARWNTGCSEFLRGCPHPQKTPPAESGYSRSPRVATADDLTISEIMVASNDGRLPQWIEIANDSTAAVSLSGWSLEIDNDSADADVVGAGDSIEIDLGDVEIGADQVALVVSKRDVHTGVDTSGAAESHGETVIYAPIASSTSRVM